MQVQAQSKSKKAQKLFDKAFTQFNLGNKEKAISLLDKSLRKDPKFSDAWSLEGLIYEGMEKPDKAIHAYKMAIEADPLYQIYYFTLAKYLFDQERYEEAEKVLEDFYAVPDKPGFNLKKDGVKPRTLEAAAKLKESCAIAKEETKNLAQLNIQNMGPAINTSDYEYWPSMTMGQDIFVFTRMLNMQEDFYISHKADTTWQKAVPLPGLINTPENEGTTSVDPEGRYIFYTVCNQDGFGSCDLFYSAYDAENNIWGKRRNLGKTVNSAFWDAQPSISADGTSLIFASARPGGYGGKDLWTTRFENGRWSVPENLGSTINTSEDEEAPFLHYDGKTLYFSSTGHPGYGQHDLFVSKKTVDGGWSKPVNIGKGVNSRDDESGLYVDRKGEKAYFASSRPGGYGGLDIYSFDLVGSKKPEPITFVKGSVFDAENNKSLSGRIEIVSLKDNAVLLRDSASRFFTTLAPGGNYALNVYRSGYLFYSANFQPTEKGIDSPFVVDAYLKKIQANVSTVLENIFFDVDKYDLKPESFVELNVLVDMMMKNPGLKVEISGHTDNSGSAEHNLELSRNRAGSVVTYLISKGIAKNRLTPVGYGSEKPMASNDTDAGKARNRRIEIRIVSE